MDMGLQAAFLEKWRTYFGGAELPICFEYRDEPGEGLVKPAVGQVCFVAQLMRARRGERIAFNAEAVGCWGGKRYLGFMQDLRPGFEYFLSYGIPGKMEGERYKKSPEVVKELMAKAPEFEAPAKHLAVRRWDALVAADAPEVVVFFAKPDVLSGLFTLAGFEESDPVAVIAPFAAGCGTIVLYPYLERKRERPRAVLGNFDVSARPCVGPDELTFAVPFEKFARMVRDMDESFLITESWNKVLRSISASEKTMMEKRDNAHARIGPRNTTRRCGRRFRFTTKCTRRRSMSCGR